MAAARRPWNTEPAVDEMSGMLGRSESVHQLTAHFVAARSDAWADSDDQVRWLRAELTCQRLHGGGGHSRSRAAPSGMNGCHGTAPGIGQEQGDAVGSPNGNREVSVIRDESIARTRLKNRRRITSQANDIASVYLSEPSNPTHAQRLSDAFPRPVGRQLQFTCREQMSGEVVERPASQCQTAR